LARTEASFYVGVDVGGTNIAAALVAESGAIVARHRKLTPRGGSSKQLLATLAETVEKVLEKTDVVLGAVAAIGVAVAGVVDRQKGRVVFTPNLSISGFELVRPLEKLFGVRVALGNDVNLGTLGEKWFGAAKQAQNVVGIFIGTGIGGGIINEGRLLRGSRQGAGEIGHIVMDMEGPRCGCGNRGCLEALASRSAIERDIRLAVKHGRKTTLNKMLNGDLSSIRSKALRRALAEEDGLVTEIMRKASTILGHACITVRRLLDPELIVLGGGVIEACGDFVMPIVEAVVSSDAMLQGGSEGIVVRSVLGDDAGVLGAAILAQELVGRLPSAESLSAAPRYPTVDETHFGGITIGGKVYDCDIYIRTNGEVKRRKKAAVKKTYGTSHKIGPVELEKVCKGDPEIIIIGTGQNGAASLTEDGEEFLRSKGIRYKALASPKAVGEYNKTDARKALLVHVTC